MNQIKDYVEVMFKELPNTSDISKVKEQIYSSMMDKYESYLEEGMNDRQAIGMVIGEFGSIEDIKIEFGINTNESYFNTDRLHEYLNFTKKYAFMIGLGVLINCLSIGLTSLVSSMNNTVLIVAIFFGGNIFGVALYIIYGMQYSNYKDLRSGDYIVDSSQHTWMASQKNKIQTSFVVQLIVGLLFIVMGLILVNLPGLSDDMQGFIFFSLVGVGVFFIINGSIVYTTFNHILTNEYLVEKAEANSPNWWGALVPIACLIYVFIGLTNPGTWSTHWVIIPIAAIITGIGSSIHSSKRKS